MVWLCHEDVENILSRRYHKSIVEGRRPREIPCDRWIKREKEGVDKRGEDCSRLQKKRRLKETSW